MLNFREEINKILREEKNKLTIQESAELFLVHVLNSINERRNLCSKAIFFYLIDNTSIYVKTGCKNITSICVLDSIDAVEIFEFVKNKLKSEKFEILLEDNDSFGISID